MSYTPKPGTGWIAHRTERAYGLMLEPDNYDGPSLFVSIEEDDVFAIGYSPSGATFVPAMLQHIARVERDFGVEAWSVKGVLSYCVLLQAVKVREG